MFRYLYNYDLHEDCTLSWTLFILPSFYLFIYLLFFADFQIIFIYIFIYFSDKCDKLWWMTVYKFENSIIIQLNKNIVLQ